MSLIKKLNTIDIKDLKNIDFRQIIDLCQARIDIPINIVLVIVSIVVAVLLPVKSITKKKADLKLINEYKEKQAVIDKYDQLKLEYDAYVEAYPQAITSDQLTNRLSEIAFKNDVHIVSFSPALTDSDDYRDIINVRIQIASENYANIILFVKDIESSPYSMRIERWAGHTNPLIQEVKDNVIEAELEIASVTLKL